MCMYCAVLHCFSVALFVWYLGLGNSLLALLNRVFQRRKCFLLQSPSLQSSP